MQRPTRIPIFGIACLIFGGLILLQNFGQLGSALIGPDGVQAPTANESSGQMGNAMRDTTLAIQAAMKEPIYRIGMGLKAVVSLLMAGALIAAGVGLLRGQSWSLRLAKIWAIYAIASGVVVTALQSVYIVPNMPDNPAIPGMAGAMYFGMVFMLVLMCIFPLLLIFVLPSRKVTAYLNRSSNEPAPTHLEAAPAIRDQPPTASHTPASPPAHPPVSAADQTWRDDPWNAPESK